VKYEAALKSDKFLLLAHGTAEEVAKARIFCNDGRNGGCSASASRQATCREQQIAMLAPIEALRPQLMESI